MERCFNTTGPCFPDEHYMLPPERRLGKVLDLIARNKYFMLHAGRQTGKTTSLIWLEQHLPTLGKRALWLDVQTAREQPDPAKAFRTLFNKLHTMLTEGGERDGLRAPEPAELRAWLEDPVSAIRKCLATLTAQDPRPFVLFVDEADCLVGETMVTFLTQVRDGYMARKRVPFPSSVVLVGMRTVRDFFLTKEQQNLVSWLGTSSPFNVSAEATMLAPFAEPEVGELLHQHTEATGQRFEPEAVTRVWELAEGHPWLTNALADQVVSNDVRDRAVPITAAHIEAAKETIILERRSHIDSLIARLREPRVARILQPMLLGDQTGVDVLHEDFAYAVGLGLLRLKGGQYQIANAIYREVIPRVLTFDRQAQIPATTAPYIRPDGALDMPKLLRAWQSFWRRDGHLAAAGFDYREAGPHLMLMAFLQRIINGGGQISREYGLGRGALDLLIAWKDERYAVEVKLRRDTHTEADAVEQLAGYLDHAGLTEGWLVLFDLRKELSWEERLTVRDAVHEGKTIHIVGC
jgi:hypothetical protein